jgi:hypothetical protein
VILLGIAILFVAAALLEWLWNMTLPEVFGLSAVTYWQAFRLILIASILFGSPGMVRVGG